MDDNTIKRDFVATVIAQAISKPVEVEVGQTVELDDGRKVLITDVAHDEVAGVLVDPEYAIVTGIADSVCDAELEELVTETDFKFMEVDKANGMPAGCTKNAVERMNNPGIIHPELFTVRGVDAVREVFCAPPQDSTEIVVGRLDGESPSIGVAPIKPLSAEEILAEDPETAQDIIDWQDATYLLLGAMMLSQGKLAARITVAQLEKFRQKYQLQFTKGKDGSLNYKVRQKPKNSGAKNV